MSTHERDLGGWLQQRGIEGPRRIVRESADTILVSKFEDGFASALLNRLGQLPALFDPAYQSSRYEAVASEDANLTRAGAWHRAALDILRTEAHAAGLSPAEVAEVEAGIDSVAALLDSVLFLGATARSGSAVSLAEQGAYRDALGRMDASQGIFTRSYGLFDGKSVVNHCPGARVARELFTLAWDICSGSIGLAAPESTQTPQPPVAGGG